MKYLISLLSIVCFSYLNAQSYKDSIIELRVIKMGELIDTSNHLLLPDEIDHFEGLAFFEVDTSYKVIAVFLKDIGKKFEMPTSTDRKPIYRKYGIVKFNIDGAEQQLTVYQNMALKKKREFKNYLFIPFRDGTTSIESYGGGRYLDVYKPKGTEIMLDFNLAYNPYCAYSVRYSCPIPPQENTLKIRIEAGEKNPLGH